MDKSMGFRKIIAIVGPTASGKSDLAVALAMYIEKNKRRLGVAGAQIVSADSRQIYAGMDIGSGKITRKEMKNVPHHLLDVASPKRTYTAAQYQKAALKIIGRLQKKNIIPIICGGTGFYIDSVLYDMAFPAVPPQPKLRKKLAAYGTEALFELLAARDPDRAERIDRYNRSRLIRAVEICMHTGSPVPSLQKHGRFDALIFGIALPREELYARIAKRLLRRMRHGMVEEVRGLHAAGVSHERLERFGLEYRNISLYLQHRLTKKEMVEKIAAETRKYAKRQMTWFKRNTDTRWINAPELKHIKSETDAFLKK